MRICFLTRTIEAGGAERQLVLLAQGLAARGHDCVILAFYGERMSVPGVRVVPLGKRGRWDALGFFLRLLGAVRRLRPDVLHAYLPVANSMAALLRLGLPRTKLVLGIRSSAMELRHYDRVTRLSWWLERWAARLADVVIVNSRAGAADAIRRGIPERLLAVVPNGVDLGRFRRDDAAGSRFRASLGVAADEILVGVVGRFDAMKDHATFLDAFARASAAVPKLRAVLVGEGPLRPELPAEAPVSLAGWQSDMSAVYSGIDLLCLSSAFGEGMPNAVAEAMACGCPCVATDVGDTRHLLGAAGRIVPPRDPAALSAAIVELALLPGAERARLGALGRARVADHFGPDLLVERTLAAVAGARPAVLEPRPYERV